MSEYGIIKKTKKPINESTIKSLLQDFCIKKDDTLVVHCSISSLGYVIGGAQTILEALMSWLEQGTLIMPSHSGDYSDPKKWENPPIKVKWLPSMYEHMPAFNPFITPLRGMGKVAELFFSYKHTLRSYHPHTSFCALGKHAEYIVKDHQLTPQFGLDSPLGKAYALHSNILLIGTDFSSCSAFHLSEVLSNTLKRVTHGAPLIVDHQKKFVWFDDFDYDSEDFASYGQKLIDEKIAIKKPLGLGYCYYVPMREAVDRVTQLMIESKKNETP